MKFCGNCGQQLEDGQTFCPFCGTKQGEVQQTTVPGQQATESAPNYAYGTQYNQVPNQTLGYINGKGITVSDILLMVGYLLGIISIFLPHYITTIEVWFDESRDTTYNLFEIGFIGFVTFFVFLGASIVFFVNKYQKPLGRTPYIMVAIQVVLYFIYVKVRGAQVSALMKEYPYTFACRKLIGAHIYFCAIVLIVAGIVMNYLKNKQKI